jgi:hypothetical protein
MGDACRGVGRGGRGGAGAPGRGWRGRCLFAVNGRAVRAVARGRVGGGKSSKLQRRIRRRDGMTGWRPSCGLRPVCQEVFSARSCPHSAVASESSHATEYPSYCTLRRPHWRDTAPDTRRHRAVLEQPVPPYTQGRSTCLAAHARRVLHPWAAALDPDGPDPLAKQARAPGSPALRITIMMLRCSVTSAQGAASSRTSTSAKRNTSIALPLHCVICVAAADQGQQAGRLRRLHPSSSAQLSRDRPQCTARRHQHQHQHQ